MRFEAGVGKPPSRVLNLAAVGLILQIAVSTRLSPCYKGY